MVGQHGARKGLYFAESDCAPPERVPRDRRRFNARANAQEAQILSPRVIGWWAPECAGKMPLFDNREFVMGAHTHVHDDGDVKFAVLCMQHQNGWTIELQQIDDEGASIGPCWRDMDRSYASLDDAKSAGVRIGLSRYTPRRP